jgi:hypothetical protein
MSALEAALADPNEFVRSAAAGALEVWEQAPARDVDVEPPAAGSRSTS